jgi:hypothetical protein
VTASGSGPASWPAADRGAQATGRAGDASDSPSPELTKEITMHRPRLFALAATAATVALLGGTAASSPAADIPSAGSTLYFKVNFSPFFYLDLGARGPSMGDQIVAHDVLLDSAGRQVGHDAVSCIVTDPSGGSEAECTATFALPRGQIATQFLNTPPAVKTFAVTGGTGAYKTARGEAVLVENGDGTGTVTFYLVL